MSRSSWITPIVIVIALINITCVVDPQEISEKAAETLSTTTAKLNSKTAIPMPPTIEIDAPTSGPVEADGLMGPGEWDKAAIAEFQTLLPEGEGGGTTNTTLYVMKDSTNLYMAIKVMRATLGVGSVVFEFDNDHDGLREKGDDVLLIGTSSNPQYMDQVRTNNPPCPEGSLPIACGFPDTKVGGTTDGLGAVTNNGLFSFYELSHPLDSEDDSHDFSLVAGDTVGFFVSVTSCSSGCVTTDSPADGPFGATAANSIDLVMTTDQWLMDHPDIANATGWQDVDGKLVSYPDWPSDWKQTLHHSYARIQEGEHLLSATPAVPFQEGIDYFFTTQFPPELAFETYSAYVALILHNEIANTLPWSILDYSPEELAPLLDGRRYFLWTIDEPSAESGDPAYEISFSSLPAVTTNRMLTSVTPGDPIRTFEFLKSTVTLAPTRLGTIENLLDWARENLIHHVAPTNLEEYWGYDGVPPVERMISGWEHPSRGFAHWTYGCHGTTGFLGWVLRTASIPVDRMTTSTLIADPKSPYHAMPYFVSEGRYLGHGDDPYGLSMKAPVTTLDVLQTQMIPIGSLLLDEETFETWFGPNVDYETSTNNVGKGRRSAQIAYPPLYLQLLHCKDVGLGLSNSETDFSPESLVYSALKLGDLKEEVDAMDFWGRLQSRNQLEQLCDVTYTVNENVDSITLRLLDNHDPDYDKGLSLPWQTYDPNPSP